MASTFGQYFQNAFGDDGSKVGYIRTHFDAVGYVCTGEDKIQGNLVGSMRNTLVRAINKEIVLPKAIILIFENDLLESLNHYQPGISLLSGRCIEWLANQIHRILVSHKEMLPSKARKFRYPTVLWTELPPHYDWSRSTGEARGKMNNCMRSTVSLFREMKILSIKDWDDCDRGLMTKCKMNSTGLISYWIGLDRAFQQWDKEQMNTKGLLNGKVQGKNSTGNSTNIAQMKKTGGEKMVVHKYREQTADENRFAWNPKKTKFKLPKPF